MKLFFSDLHMSDGKERDDFQFHREFDGVVTKWSKEFKKVELVFLGDIFDLIRTQKYYEFPELSHTEIKRKVMEDILKDHAPFFETLQKFAEKVDHRLRYVVGNHDFGASLDQRLMEMIQQKFELLLVPEYYYKDETSKIWAEHGNRYDILNSTFEEDGTPIPYCFGDRIVVEIVDKFFDEVRQEQAELGIDPRMINDLDNVRPQSAILYWLDSIDPEGRLKGMFVKTIAAFISSNPGDLGSLVWDFFFENYPIKLEQAAKKLGEEGYGKYVIFGHTHAPLSADLGKGIRYFNTGTWRKFIEPSRRITIRETVPSFVEGGTQFYEERVSFHYEFKTTINLSYLVFFEKGEGRRRSRLVYQKPE